jgi:glycosyltransferase involved in cell wall biosynthesis
MHSDPPPRPGVEGAESERETGPRPRVLLVGRTRYALPLSASLAAKFEALEHAVDLRVLASAASGRAQDVGPFELLGKLRPAVFDGVAFYARLPFRIARQLRGRPTDAVIAQSPYEGAAALLGRAAARRRTRVIVEVHGDWRTATRLYGSRLRSAVSPFADAVSRYAVRHADAVRTVSPYTTALVEEQGITPADTFPAFMDLGPFLERPPVPPPDQPVALFVGVLEAYKNVDGLAEAWRIVARRLPEAQLVLVGSGSRAEVVERLREELPSQTVWHPRLTTAEVAGALDSATVLVLPSRSEGMGRVIIEALCRSRPVIGARVGGIADLLTEGVNGLLVEPGDTAALAEALVKVLSDRALAERLGGGARSSVEPWLATPADYASRTRDLVDRVSAHKGS